MAVNNSAFTKADLEAYKDACQNGALTAMLNYYRNLATTAAVTTERSKFQR